MGIFGKPRLHFQIFPNFLHFQIPVPLPSYLSNSEHGLSVRHIMSERRRQLLMIKLAVFKKKYYHYNVGNSFASV